MVWFRAHFYGAGTERHPAIADGIDPITHIRRAAANTNMHMSFAVGGNASQQAGYFLPIWWCRWIHWGRFLRRLSLPNSGIPTTGSDDDRLYTGLVEPSYLGGGLPMARMASTPKGTATYPVSNLRFPNAFPPAVSLSYTEGDHGVLANPLSESGISMQLSITLLRQCDRRPPMVEPTSAPPFPMEVSWVDGSGGRFLGCFGYRSRCCTAGHGDHLHDGDATDPVSAVFDTNGDAGSLAGWRLTASSL